MGAGGKCVAHEFVCMKCFFLKNIVRIMFSLLLQARRAQARMMSKLQDDGGGGDAAAVVAPTLDEQLQAACVPLTGCSAAASERLSESACAVD